MKELSSKSANSFKFDIIGEKREKHMKLFLKKQFRQRWDRNYADCSNSFLREGVKNIKTNKKQISERKKVFEIDCNQYKEVEFKLALNEKNWDKVKETL